MAAGEARVMSSPHSWTRPSSARINPERTRRAVDLPAPFAPISATTWPSPTSKEMPLSAVI